jgi:hypothetical protein
MLRNLLCLGLLTAATMARADWSRDIPFQSGNLSATYDGVEGIHDGPVVADVVPTWSGKEVLQATRTSVVIMSADNAQQPLDLPIPAIAEPDPMCQVSEPPFVYEFIAGQPAVGDVDGDGRNEIVVGVTYQCIHGDVYLYFSSVVWWTWNGSGFDAHSLSLPYQQGDANGLLCTPTICRTGWTGGQPTVVFWGPVRVARKDTLAHSATFALTAFDLRSTQRPRFRQSEIVSENSRDGLGIWAKQSGITAQAADVNGDGMDEVVVHSNHRVAVYRFDAKADRFVTSWDAPLYELSGGRAFLSGHATLADVDADGELEYLVEYSSTTLSRGRLLQLNFRGQLEHAYGDVEDPVYPLAGTQPVVCDMGARLSPISSSPHDSRMYDAAKGALRTGEAWPIGHLYFADARNVSDPACADVMELGRPQFIRVDVGLPAVGLREIRVYDPLSGDTVFTADLDVPALDTISGPVTSSSAFCDLDGKGQGAFVTSFRTGENTLRIFRTNSGHALSPEAVEWQQIGNGPEHKGLYAQPVGGSQPLPNAVWSGRIVVMSDYTVGENQSLVIKAGTVVEFKSGANLVVLGSLSAMGTVKDSIYFKADGAAAWGSIILESKAGVSLDYCMIHGGSGVDSRQPVATIRHCRIEGARP